MAISKVLRIQKLNVVVISSQMYCNFSRHCMYRCGLLLQMSIRSVVCLSVCPLVTLVSHSKTVEAIEMLFGGHTCMDQRNHLLNGVRIGESGEHD